MLETINNFLGMVGDPLGSPLEGAFDCYSIPFLGRLFLITHLYTNNPPKKGIYILYIDSVSYYRLYINFIGAGWSWLRNL